MKKTLSFILSALLMASSMSLSVNADTLNTPAIIEESTSDAVVYSTGLIYKYSLSISKSGNTIYISGYTECGDTMKTLGFKNLMLQRSINGTDWDNYQPLDDILNTSSRKCDISNKNLGTVPTGYHYRVTCTHYAKETGLFGKSESIANTSNSV